MQTRIRQTRIQAPGHGAPGCEGTYIKQSKRLIEKFLNVIMKELD